VLEENADIGVAAVALSDLVEQVRELLLERFIDE
jgi:hypothetical protein